MSVVIPLPAGVAFEDAEIGLERADQVMRSGYTGRRQTLSWPYALWVFTARTVPEEGVAAGRLRSFLLKLKGRVNVFRMPVPGAYNLAGWKPTNNPTLLDNRAAGASIIAIAGAPVSTLIFREGDYLTVNDECKLVAADVVSYSDGTAAIPFNPPLRRATTAGLPVEVKEPYILLSAATSDMAKWKLSRPVRHTFNFAAIEAYE